MQSTEEIQNELNENAMDLMGELEALQCVLYCHRNTDICISSTAIKDIFLLRIMDYIHQHTHDIRILSKCLVRRAIEEDTR